MTCRVLNIARQPHYRWLTNPVTAAEWAEAPLTCDCRVIRPRGRVAGVLLLCRSRGLWWRLRTVDAGLPVLSRDRGVWGRRLAMVVGVCEVVRAGADLSSRLKAGRSPGPSAPVTSCFAVVGRRKGNRASGKPCHPTCHQRHPVKVT